MSFIDVVGFLSLLVLGVAFVPLFTSRRRLPRIVLGTELELESLEQGQTAYEASLVGRRVLRWGFLALLVYFLGRALLGPAAPLDVHVLPIFVACLGIAFAVGTLAAALWRYRWDVRFVEEHPTFADSLQPLKLRLLGPIVVLAAFALLTFSASAQDGTLVFGGLAATVVFFVLAQRVALAAVVRSQIAVPPDSPLGQAASEAVSRFGFTPRRVVLVPSTLANAFALPDGSVMITTALRHVASNREIAAILAHELSHVRDRDLRRIQLSALLGLGAMTLTMLAIAMPMTVMSGSGPFFVPIIVLSALNAMQIAALVRSRTLRRLEFKCDRAAATLGFGEDLRRGLEKIYRYSGVPHRWVGYERLTATHPSLDERFKALEGLSGAYPRP